MRKVNLEFRKKVILKAIIDAYVQTADPVGSYTLNIQYHLDLSPATIRQTMAELERVGYICHPYTSAGRVPTDKGYRYYVDYLLDETSQSAPEEERGRLEKKFWVILRQIRDMEELIGQALKLLTFVVRQGGVAICPRLKKSKFKYLQLIPGTHQKIQVILLTDSGTVRSFIINAPGFKNNPGLYRLLKFLNQELRGKDLDKLESHLLRKLEMKRDALIEKSLELLHLLHLTSLPEENHLHLQGTRYILEQPEFQDTNRLREIMMVLEDEKALIEILNRDLDSEGINIHIGQENRYAGVRQCSLVTCRYKIKDRPVGIIGVLGTTRMEYAKVSSWVSCVAQMLSKAISEIIE